jgi:hypothetical protein
MNVFFIPILSVIMSNDIMLSVKFFIFKFSVIMPNAIMLSVKFFILIFSVIMPNAVMMNVFHFNIKCRYAKCHYAKCLGVFEIGTWYIGQIGKWGWNFCSNGNCSDDIYSNCCALNGWHRETHLVKWNHFKRNFLNETPCNFSFYKKNFSVIANVAKNEWC